MTRSGFVSSIGAIGSRRVASFRDHDISRLTFEQAAVSLPNDRMIVNQKNGNPGHA